MLTAAERRFLEAVSKLTYGNPFSPERIEWEREALGEEFVAGEPVWSLRVDRPEEPRENAWRIAAKTEALVERLRGQLDGPLYEDAVVGHLYSKYLPALWEGRWGVYREFRRDWERFRPAEGEQARHLFACFYQVSRAFQQIFANIVGGSMAAARLRGSVWQSVFTHDMRRYRRGLWAKMGDFPTLVTGPSGTGKELVARAIALARYVPFDQERMRFAGDGAAFHPINVAALPATLVESELFGHRRGSFTGAVEDRKGWLEACTAEGTVFLDEIGDLEPAVQVKLLRVIETREFQRLGETTRRRFEGKLVAATNRDLATMMAEGRFREDLYYRLCGDMVRTPTLAEQVRERPEVLAEAALFLARQVAGEEAEAVAAETVEWIARNLGPEYPWPGNYRELGQCVRNILVRKEYRPPERKAAGAREELARAVRNGELGAEELLRRYCTLVYAEAGTYEQAARRLGLDRRTVKSRVDREWLKGA